MSTSPLISIILPSYNHVDFVTTAVESVLNQQIKDFELIIVDDGSTDGTPDRVEKIKDSRIRLIRLEQNRLRHPRNLALSLAKGRYIAFQNSDDEWLPEKLAAQVDILEQQKGVVACFTDVELIDDHHDVITSSWANGWFTTENRTNLAWLRLFFKTENRVCISSACVRNQAIAYVGGFRGSFIQASDLDLWVRLAAIGEFHIINEKLTRLRIVGGKTANNVKAEALAPAPTRQMRAGLPPIKTFIKKAFDKKTIEPSSQKVEPLVTSDNLSAPKVSTNNRLLFEFADILGNFANPPILNLVPHIFEDVMPVLKDSIYIRQAWLAKYAWSLNTVQHSLFADQLMVSIMNNEAARNEVVDIFGAAIIKEFVQRRGQFSMGIIKEFGQE